MAAPAADTEKRAPTLSAPSNGDFPDGGLQAWLVVVGGFCTIFASFGWINCIGIFQNYYQANLLSHYSSSAVAWIPSTESFMMFFWGPVVGKITDHYGPRVPILIGSFLHVFGLMMTSISREYYQIFLAQSVCSAIGCSFVFYPAMTACSTWFLRHRALAIGIMASGSSIGGVVLPIMVNRLVVQIGFGWTMRALAFLLLGMVSVGILTVKSRLPPLKQPLALMDFIVPWKEMPFLLLGIGSWFLYIGGFIPFTFIIVQARAQGMSTGLAGYLVSILNGASTFGRIIPAHFGDIIGVFNIMIALTSLGAVSCIALWLPSTVMESGQTNALIIIFTIFYGFASGCVFSIIPAMIAKISPDVRKLGVRTGSLYAVSATGVLIGSPIAGAIASSSGNGFLGLTLFSGLLLVVGAVFVVAARLKLTGLKLMAKA
ncbi:monocarboxylate permease-like protein [Pseudovirgaria hyperparasitica]|uniref:Monocarboxylate permease-like protein n=1 Tax=Pseudovirgaria hyperparasitica TaxID=470096 RepID=A0A6A6WJJ0_9PEZI|nr:monocarboxylate permease-like protein [Pseudovirgaria hyperparasitica]KAF2762425.1 monocarboxylate permease-like protein [Pseudovirgaria hyperparasitica]